MRVRVATRGAGAGVVAADAKGPSAAVMPHDACSAHVLAALAAALSDELLPQSYVPLPPRPVTTQKSRAPTAANCSLLPMSKWQRRWRYPPSWAMAQSRRRPVSSGEAAPTSTMTSAGRLARFAAAMIASGEGAS